MGEFDDLLPAAGAAAVAEESDQSDRSDGADTSDVGAFEDLVPQEESKPEGAGEFSDLVPEADGQAFKDLERGGERLEAWHPSVLQKLQMLAPSVFGPVGEQAPDAMPKGLLPILTRLLYGKATKAGERAEPGLLRFSPATVIPEQGSYGGELARQATGLVNIENLSLIKALGVLHAASGPVATWAKAATAAYFAKQGAEGAAQALGARTSGAPMTGAEQAQSDFQTGMGALMVAAPVLEAAAGLKGSAKAEVRGATPEQKVAGPSEFGGLQEVEPEAETIQEQPTNAEGNAAPVEENGEAASGTGEAESDGTESAGGESGAAGPSAVVQSEAPGDAAGAGDEDAVEEEQPSGQGALIMRGLLQDATRRGEDVPAQWLEQFQKQSGQAWTLPEGYQLEGDTWKFKPVERETEATRMAREQREAMDALRKSKAESQAESPKPKVETQPTERAEAGTPGAALGERPPDILDWIEESFPRGVKLPGKADFGDYLSRATGKAKELLGLNRGEPADQVLKAMHEAGAYTRLGSVDDLAEAIVRAGEARKGWREQNSKLQSSSPSVEVDDPWAETISALNEEQPDRVEQWFNNAIEAVKPGTEWMGQASMGLAKVPVWLTQEAATLGLRAARAAYVVTRDVSKAIAAGVEALRGAQGFEEGEARNWLTGALGGMSEGPVRQRVERILEGDASANVKTAVAPDLNYQVRRFQQIEQEAQAIIAQHGPDVALEIFKRPNSRLSPDTRTALGAALEEQFKTAERVARAKGDTAAADALADKQVELWKADAYGTELAQGLNARKLFDRSGPQAQLKIAQELFEESSKGQWERQKPAVDQVKEAVEGARQDAVEGVRQDAETNRAAREAVDEHVANSAETHQAVVMELAEPWASSPEIVRMAREQVRSKADELLNRQPRPAGLTPAQHLRAIMDDLAKRAASIAAGHYQGAEPGVTLANKLQQRLGLDAERAGRLAKQLDAEWARQVEKAKKSIPKRIVNQRARRELKEEQKAKLPPEEQSAQRVLDRFVRSQKDTPELGKSVKPDLVKEAVRKQLRERGLDDEAFARQLQKLGVKPGTARVLSSVVRREMTIVDAVRQAEKTHADVESLINQFAKVQSDTPSEAVKKTNVVRELVKQQTHGVAPLTEEEFVSRLTSLGVLPDRAEVLARVAARERYAREFSGQTPVDIAIRKQLREMNVKLGDLLKQESSKVDATGKSVAERIVQASGLKGDKAEALRDTLEARYQALLKQAGRARLEQMEKAGVKLPKKVKSMADDLVQLARLGAFDDARFYELAKKKLDLPVMTDELAREIVRRANALEQIPEGNLRDREAARLMGYVLQQRGMNLRDLPLGIFYANILSGVTTPAKIVLENENLLVGQTLVSLLSRPGELAHPVSFAKALVEAYGRGLAKGGLQAAETLRSGVLTGVWEKPQTPTVLELKPFGEKWDMLNFWKWFGRVVSTSHELTFKPAWEIKQTLMAREVARKEGLTGKALEQRTADLMADTEKHVARARAQALQELQSLGKVDKLDLARRTREIIEQQRELNMPGSTAVARDFALRSSYLNEPWGFMGLLTRGIRSTLEEARKEFPVLGSAAKTQIPFTTIVANILNEKLNWTPVGLVRAGLSHKTGELYGRPMLDANERAELYTKAIVGTVALSALASLFGKHIHGNGPGTPERRRQLQAAGWVPHSIEYNGRYYSYMNTPMALGLAVVGNFLDWQRYGKGENADGASRLAFAAKATANAIVSQGMLDSVKRVFEALGSESSTEGADKLQRLTARTAGSLVVPNLVNQVDRIFDPTIYDQTGVEALVKGQIPFVRRENRPALSVLGDKVEAGPFRYWGGKQTEDPLLRTLAEKQAWVPEPSRAQIVGDRKAGPDHYRAITPDELYDLVAESGPRIRARLERALDSASEVGGTIYPPLRDAEPWQAQAVVRHVAEEETARAKSRLRF